MSVNPQAEDLSDIAFEISRTLEASPERVYRAWTENGQLRQWWGPEGFPVRECTMEFRRGGIFHYCLAGKDGTEMWGKWVITEIVANRRLEFIVAFSAEDSDETTRHPFEPDWPLEIMTEVRFMPISGGTRVDIRWIPLNAGQAEIRRFVAGHEDCRRGWTGTLDQLDEYLAEN